MSKEDLAKLLGTRLCSHKVDMCECVECVEYAHGVEYGEKAMKRVELNEGSYAFVLAQTALLNCRVAGMQAENRYRISIGESIAYGSDEFLAVEREFGALIGANEILEMLRMDV